MDLSLQTKLLRFLQTSTIQPVGAARPIPVDVRIVCATNRDPAEEVRRGRFREDLYYRLHVVPIHMPPLRVRPEDIMDIAQASLVAFAAEEGKAFTGFDAEVAAVLTSRPWPGNVRQLLNVIRNIVVLHDGPLVTPTMLPHRDRARARRRRSPPTPVAALPPPRSVPRPEHARPGGAPRRHPAGRRRARADRGDDRPLRRLDPARRQDARALALDDLPQARDLDGRAAALRHLSAPLAPCQARRPAAIVGLASTGRKRWTCSKPPWPRATTPCPLFRLQGRRGDPLPRRQRLRRLQRRERRLSAGHLRRGRRHRRDGRRRAHRDRRGAGGRRRPGDHRPLRRLPAEARRVRPPRRAGDPRRPRRRAGAHAPSARCCPAPSRRRTSRGRDDATRATAAARALACLDLTNLDDGCDEAAITDLCRRARTPHGPVAAVCIWPDFVEQARAELAGHRHPRRHRGQLPRRRRTRWRRSAPRPAWRSPTAPTRSTSWCPGG